MSLDAQAEHQKQVAAAAKAAAAVPPLDPSFPFRRDYFDPFFFNVQLDAKESATVSLFPEPL